MVDAAVQFAGRDGALRWWRPLDGKPALIISADAIPETDIGRMLLRQNERSCAARYKESDRDQTDEYCHRATNRRFTPAQIINVLRNYRAQGNHADDWQQTEARSFCDALEAAVLWTAFPPGADDHWEWTDALLNRTAA